MLSKTQIAQICHENNKNLCELLGDFSQMSWLMAPAEIKASAIIGVETVLADPDITSEQIHQSWMDFKIDNGWVYGEVKDHNEKTHPCIVPYHQLPAEQRLKDALFIATVRALA